MSFKHRAIIDSIPSYKQGKPAPAASGLVSYKISSNENPYGPLPSVVEAIEDKALGQINRYPDMHGTALVERLAARYGVGAENLVLGCGSTEVITQLVNLLAGPGDTVVYPWRSFEAYPIIVAAAGAQSVQVPNRPDGGHDVEAMLAAIDERTRLVIVNNPNNPTSASVSQAEVRRIMEALPSDLLVLFDEAYFQFNTDSTRSQAMELFRDYPNVVVAHTFSKAYGLAGLRIGYAIAPADVADGMRKVALPFGVTAAAQTAAMASLDAQEELDLRVQALIEERDRMVESLGRQGWRFPKPFANFFWLPLGEHTAQAAQAFQAAGLATRVFNGEGIRISVGEREANDRVIQVCAQLKKQGF
ncbi:histidinol-phosphate transaminase [Bifidobacterium aemilianum]|uniref:Histidinol-phosphate aminotransferase n=1 Tax=Bifidobacterium aemilianum TaxID=2493120 RepID=A0A366K8E1_9BIFI|nr:histidinol-phosphate transaminase [Bifidobacterium aemilianum]RBP97587.1 histidinol-phosphate transaminase [Bifidobacterium aemilianum]